MHHRWSPHLVNKIYFCSYVQAHSDDSANSGVHTWKKKGTKKRKKRATISLTRGTDMVFVFISFNFPSPLEAFISLESEQQCAGVCEAQPIITLCFSCVFLLAVAANRHIWSSGFSPLLPQPPMILQLSTELNNQLGDKCVAGMSTKGQSEC